MRPWQRLRDDAAFTGAATAVLMTIAGFVVLGATWRGIAAESLVPLQVPFAVSGALSGLALVGAGGVFANVHAARRIAARRRDLLDDVARALADRAAGGPVPTDEAR